MAYSSSHRNALIDFAEFNGLVDEISISIFRWIGDRECRDFADANGIYIDSEYATTELIERVEDGSLVMTRTRYGMFLFGALVQWMTNDECEEFAEHEGYKEEDEEDEDEEDEEDEEM